MKKLFSTILVLGLLLSGNAKAATPFTYLSCKQIVKDNKSEDWFGKQDFLNNGKYVSHMFYKFKHLKKMIYLILLITTIITLCSVYLNKSKKKNPKLFIYLFSYLYQQYLFI